MNKTYSKLICGIFVLFLAVVAGGSVLAPKVEFSQMENRVLKYPPRLTATTVREGVFMQDAEAYLSDHVIGRDFWFCGNAAIERCLGSQELAGVYLCDGGTLIQREKTPETAALEKHIAAFRSYSEKSELPVYLAIVPTAAAIWADRLPANADSAPEAELIARASLESGTVPVDLIAVLQAHADEDIYYRTDHHWTSRGALYGVNAILEAVGQTPIQESELSPETVSTSFYGTLYSKTGAFWVRPDSIERLVPEDGISVTAYNSIKPEEGKMYFPERLELMNQYTYFLGGNKPLVILKNEKAAGGKLLLVRDSYGDPVGPLLTLRYSEVHLFDTRYNRASLRTYAEENCIDTVVVLVGYNTFISEPSLLLVGR